ncbi:acyl dehydratase [Mycolicibacterium sp. BK556]|uniref:MaoC family dehydratase n=1 Tax=unclassified Mycolicibacterium TaxID=2636767 RepID=UPI001610E6CE|nr:MULTISPECIES: MaoC family dehydratase [unclassified Mycolicibacterium]MBB3606016.1 acyl dehydratase [Mycolicibacterium sp. BK556]MBB3632593.1 acyl dehydratase [Mycolicibacterium sp. BK607]
MKVIASIDDAHAAAGIELGVSDWLTVDQARIDAFAAATGDNQWIHVDRSRAAAESPYGTTIAHGLLTLSLVPALSKQCFVVDNAKMGVNYGLNKVRFVSPVPADARVRVRSRLVEVTSVDDSTVQLTVNHTVEVDGATKPAAVAEMIGRYVF